MVKELIEIGANKLGSKRKLGIALGFPEKSAGQRVQKLIDNQNLTLKTFKKLLIEAQLFDILDIAIAAEYRKIDKK